MIEALQIFDPFQQRRQQLVIGQLLYLLSLFKDHAPAIAAGNTVVGFPGFTGAVDHTAHDRHGDGLFTVFQGFVNLIYQTDEINAGSAAGGAGNDVDAFLPEAGGLQNVLGSIDFLNGIVGKADPDGIADAIQQQSADAMADFMRPCFTGPVSVTPMWIG